MGLMRLVPFLKYITIVSLVWKVFFSFFFLKKKLYRSPSCKIRHEPQQKDVAGGPAVGAELNGYGDFHFTFV